MTKEFKRYERLIKKKHCFGWTPHYEEEFDTKLNETVFFSIAKAVFEKVGWDLLGEEASVLRGKRGAEWTHWGQKITVRYASGKVKVKSESLGNRLWDWGRNSKRVKLFIYAFKQLASKYDDEALKELETEVLQSNNFWEDYEVPATLPPPRKRSQPKLWVPFIGAVLLSIVLGFAIAFFTTTLSYVIGLYEVFVGFLTGLGFKYLIQLSRYNRFDRLNYLLVAVVLMTFFWNQYFLYRLFVFEQTVGDIGFVGWMQIRFQQGLNLRSTNVGSIGLLISWIFQIGFTYAVAYVQLATHVTEYQLKQVPMEVVDFAFYHFVQGKEEAGVRVELSKMGWSETEDQNDVFHSIGALQGLRENELE
ncbi:MAG: hypothetical protein AAF985_00605 [Bacteroidota bacterium]